MDCIAIKRHPCEILLRGYSWKPRRTGSVQAGCPWTGCEAAGKLRGREGCSVMLTAVRSNQSAPSQRDPGPEITQWQQIKGGDRELHGSALLFSLAGKAAGLPAHTGAGQYPLPCFLQANRKEEEKRLKIYSVR